MAIIPRRSLFSWKNVESKSDLDRLRLVLEALSDEALMVRLEEQRGKGRDDYPVRAMWNSLLAGIVFQHESSDAYSRFLKNLLREAEKIQEIFDSLLGELTKLLPDLGRHLGVDSKAIETCARGRKDPADSSDQDADWGTKTKRGKRADGTMWEKLTKASRSDSPELIPLLKDLRKRRPDRIEVAQDLSADKGYDSSHNNAWLWDECEIKPLIDIRSMWKEKETRLLEDREADNVVYDEVGQLYCHCPHSGQRRQLAYQGFEKDRQCLKYRCPAAAYDFRCAGRRECGRGHYGRYGRVVRIPLEKDRRIFTPIARSSYAWSRAYKRR